MNTDIDILTDDLDIDEVSQDEIDARRYMYVRKLIPLEFENLWYLAAQKSIIDFRDCFDALVDDAIAKEST